MMLNSFLCTMYSICFLFSEISSELLFSVWLTLLMLSSEFLAYCRHKSFTIWMSCQRLLSVFLYCYTVMIKEERKTFFLKKIVSSLHRFMFMTTGLIHFSQGCFFFLLFSSGSWIVLVFLFSIMTLIKLMVIYKWCLILKYSLLHFNHFVFWAAYLLMSDYFNF